MDRCQTIGEQRFLIITPVYNAEEWIEKCIKSTINQTHTNFVHVIVDDCSTDNTWKKLQEAVGADSRYHISRSNKRFGPLVSHLTANSLSRKQSWSDCDIFVHLDGDDWLYDETVLQKVADVYATTGCWATYGSYVSNDPNYPRVARPLPPNTSFRDQAKAQWIFSHLRTFKRFLWEGLDQDCFVDQSGRYYTSAADVAIFLPVLERAGPDNVHFIDEPLYVYNRECMNEDDESVVNQIRSAMDIFAKEPMQCLSQI